MSVNTAVPIPSVPSDQWNNTKFEIVSQARNTDSDQTWVRTEPPHGTHDSFEETEGIPTSTEINKVAL